jgi:hypothetical protein
MITAEQRRTLLTADRTGINDVVSAMVADVLESKDATPLDVELAFRDAAAQSYLIAGSKLFIVRGVLAWIAALKSAGVTPQANRAALAARSPGK